MTYEELVHQLDIRLLAVERVLTNAGQFIVGFAAKSPEGRVVAEAFIHTMRENIGFVLPNLPPGSPPVDLEKLQRDDEPVRAAELEIIDRWDRMLAHSIRGEGAR